MENIVFVGRGFLNSEKIIFRTHFPFDGKCSYFVRMCRLSGDIEYRRAEYGHLTSKRCCKSLVSDKTNLTRSAHSLLTARESAQKSADLLSTAVARRTCVLRTAVDKAPYNLLCEILVDNYICLFLRHIPIILACASKTLIYEYFTLRKMRGMPCMPYKRRFLKQPQRERALKARERRDPQRQR